MNGAVHGPCSLRRAPLALASLIACAVGSSHAGTFELPDGWQGSSNTTVSLGSSWRAQRPDAGLYTAPGGAAVGLTGGTGANQSDGGNLNYGKGDRFSTVAKIVSDVELKRGDVGGLLRVKAWYDQALADHGVRYGNQPSGFAAGQPLSDEGFEPAQRFKGVSLLDAYVYRNLEIGDKPLQVRLGRQVVNWGESLYIQGLNQINPLDVPALRRPGAELKEGLIPQWMLYGNLGLGGGRSIEAFYQLRWEPTAVDGCDTYWSTVEFQIARKPGLCNKGMAAPAALLDENSGIANGFYYPMVDGTKPKNGGQGGVSVRLPVEALDTEIGLYAMNLHSRVPIFSTRTGAFNGVPAGGLLNPLAVHAGFGAQPVAAFWEYLENVRYFGASATTTLAGWSVASEVSHTPNLPVQRNGNDLINGLVVGAGPLGGQAIAATAAGAGTTVSGYDRLRKTQLQVNAVNLFKGVAGADELTLIGEVGTQWVNVPDRATGIRYGRASIFGLGSNAQLDTCSAASPLHNTQADGCLNEGFVTRFSWGYRARVQAQYFDVGGSGFTVRPSIFLGHDVKGYSADGQFLEGRRQLGFGMGLDFDKRYSFDLNYVRFVDTARYDPLRDRDYYSASLAAKF